MISKHEFMAPIFGAEGNGRNGYLNEANIVRTTIDGVDLNELWADFQESTNYINAHFDHLVELMTLSLIHI